jgi:hypothetical protein
MYITPRTNPVFRGSHSNAKRVLQLKGIMNPVFTHFDRSATIFFGEPCAIVPQGPYTLYQSSKIDDIMAGTSNWDYEYTEKNSGTSGSGRFREKPDFALKSAAKTYKKIRNKSVYSNEKGNPREVIMDVANYWAIPCRSEIKTYGELVELLKTYKPKDTKN